MTNAPIDTFKLPVMLTALRLPSFQKHLQEIAEQADKEAWPAARFLAVLLCAVLCITLSVVVALCPVLFSACQNADPKQNGRK